MKKLKPSVAKKPQNNYNISVIRKQAQELGFALQSWSNARPMKRSEMPF